MRDLTVLSLILSGLISAGGYACTTFCLSTEDGPVFGRNYDWVTDVCLLMVNKRNVSKVAMNVDNPAMWTSKFGSVTFNQYGRELPTGGINEAGLIVEQMWLNETEFATPDARQELSTLQWVQYQLDTAMTIDDVIASDEKVRIDKNATPLHFLVCDASGDCAVIEFLNGETVVHSGDTLPYKALTNNTYADSLAFSQGLIEVGEQLQIPGSADSLDRFTRAADKAEEYDPTNDGDAEDYAFSILDNVAQGEFTVWSIVYNFADSKVYFKTLNAQEIRYINLNKFDFDNKTPVTILDMNDKGSGDVTDKFVEYTYEANRDLIGSSFSNTDFLSDIPKETLDALASYPESTLNE